MPRRCARSRTALVLTIGLAGAALGACSSAPPVAASVPAPLTVTASLAPAAPAAATSGSAALTAFADCDGLVEHLRGLARPYVTAHGFGNGVDVRSRGGGWTEPAEPPSETVHLGGPPRDRGVLTRESASDNPSLTGQENAPAGTASNGRLLVSLGGDGTLHVVDVSGRRPVARGALDVSASGLGASRILLGKRRALLLGGPTAPEGEGRHYGLGIAVVDLTDPDHPRLESAEVVTGGLVSASIAGDVARVVVGTAPYLRFREPEGDADARAQAAALGYNRNAVEKATVADWLPSRSVLGPAGRPDAAAPLVACSDVLRPAEDSGLQVLSVLAFDLARRGVAPGSAAVVADTGVAQTAANHLYVATYPGAWGRAPGSSNEMPDVRRTVVHEFAADHGRPAYVASGSVAGWVPKDWALSPDGDRLRVYTVTPGWHGSAEPNAVTVMRRQKANLTKIRRFEVASGWYSLGWFGDIVATGLGRGPTVHLVRVSGSGPAASGALDVPNFVNFLAADGHFMLAVGDGGDSSLSDESDDSGAAGGLQVSSYDITDPAVPRLADRFAFDPPSTTEGDGDATHFEFIPGQGNLVMPAYTAVHGKWYEALEAVHVAADGKLSSAGRRLVRATSEKALAAGGPSISFFALPDGRIALLNASGLTLLSPKNLSVLGSVTYSTPEPARPKGSGR